MRTTAFILGAIALWSSPAFAGAKIEFSAYEGPPQISVGNGGTRIAKNGIDYWTSGTPPRRYQVIGLVQDKRDETWDGGHAIGSPSIAEKVKKAGGDAVIVQSQEEAGRTGGYGSGSGAFAFLAMGGSKTITSMLVVKYLPEDATSPAPAPTATSSPTPPTSSPPP